jgi:hypothetical protein
VQEVYVGPAYLLQLSRGAISEHSCRWIYINHCWLHQNDASGDEQDGDLENEATEEMETPRSTTSSRKRSFSTADTTLSPSKGLHIPKRLHIASVMQGLVDQLQVVSAEDKKTLESIT